MNRNQYFLKFDDGNKQTNLSINDVMNYEDMYPGYEEQKKIAAYFRTLDHLITLHQHKCDELKNSRNLCYKICFCKERCENMILYHGSNIEVKNPQIIKSRKLLDFGAGFYLTSDYGQAKKWAVRTTDRRGEGSPVISVYMLM